MADKETALSIVIRTVDKATAKIQAINKTIESATKPVTDFKKEWNTLWDKNIGEKLGLTAVREGFRGVGEAVTRTAFRLLEVGAVVGEVAHLVFELVDHFEALGKVSARVGVEADFLAGMRYAATKTGATVEQLDEGVQTFAQNLGQAKAGTGRMTKFLMQVSPALLAQLKATHSTEEALGLLSNAMAKVTDRSKLLALAQKTLGDGALAPLFHEGSKAILEQLSTYAGLAGSQQGAVDGATAVGEALKDLHAATDGAKAAIVTGLSPALAVIVDKLKQWFVDHRADIARWAEDIGKKLPGAVQDVVTWIGKAYDRVSAFIDKVGGLQTVALAVAASITGPLIASIISLGIAMMSSPAGLVLAGLGALALGIAHVAMGPDPKTQPESVTSLAATGGEGYSAGAGFNAASDRNEARRTAAKLPTVEYPMVPTHQLPTVAYPLVPPQQASAGSATIKVDFMNVPKGARVTADPRNTADVDLSVGYQMGGSW